MKTHRLTVKSEIVYVLAQVLCSFAVAMVSAADFGVSMVVAPAYVLSLKLSFLTFGQCEYIVQGLMFIAFCIVMKRFRVSYLFSFVTCLIYGALLDFWRWLIPHFNPAVYAGGALPMPLRIAYFVGGAVLTSFAVALYLRTYIYPQVYEFFVKGITVKYHIRLTLFKYIFDGAGLLIAVSLSLIFFQSFRGVGIGTLIMTVVNSFIIGAFNKLFDKTLNITPFFPKAEAYFNNCIS